MAAKNAKRPRPGKNSDGQDKKPQPTMSHDISISPGKPAEPAPPPGAPMPGHTNPMTHPAHPSMQSSLQSGSPHAGPSAQVQERIQFKDLQPPAQNQVLEQQGIDPYAPMKQAQSALDQGLAQGSSGGPIPNALQGPYLPPDVANFPDDMAHLQTLMSQGFAPGANPQEHQLGLNAHSMAQAKVTAAMQNAQQGAGSPTVTPPAPMPPMAPPGPPQGVGMPSQPPMQAGPPMSSSMAPPVQAGPPVAPGAPGGVPPELIAAIMQGAKRKRPVR